MVCFFLFSSLSKVGINCDIRVALGLGTSESSRKGHSCEHYYNVPFHFGTHRPEKDKNLRSISNYMNEMGRGFG